MFMFMHCVISRSIKLKKHNRMVRVCVCVRACVKVREGV